MSVLRQRQARAVALAAVLAGAVFSQAAIAQGSWVIKASSPSLRRNVAFARLGNVIYAAGGAAPCSTSSVNTVEAYNTVTDTWIGAAFLPQLPVATQQAAAGTIGTKIYVAGGGTCCGALNTLQVFDGAAWSTQTSMPTARYGPSAAVTSNLLFVVGGSHGFGPLYQNLEVYNLQTNSWMTAAQLPAFRYQVSACAADGIFYAIGGVSTSGVALSTVEAYNPVTDEWTTKASMPTGRAQAGSAVFDGQIYTAGGYSAAGSLSTVEIYNPSTDSWSSGPSMPGGLAGGAVGAFEINGVLYVLGLQPGSNCPGSPISVFALESCYADCNESGSLTIADFGCFQSKFVAGCP